MVRLAKRPDTTGLSRRSAQISDANTLAARPARSLARPLLSVFVTGENVSLRPNPSPGRATLSLLNYEVVTVSDFQVGPTGSKLHIWVRQAN